MDKGTRFVGLDVHKASITVAVAGAFGDPEDHGQIPNESAAIRKLVDRLGSPDTRIAAGTALPAPAPVFPRYVEPEVAKVNA